MRKQIFHWYNIDGSNHVEKYDPTNSENSWINAYLICTKNKGISLRLIDLRTFETTCFLNEALNFYPNLYKLHTKNKFCK